MFCTDDYLEDFIAFGPGHSAVDIVCGQPIETVWVSFEDCDGVPICHAHVDKVGVQVACSSFIIYADIHSNVRTVRWRAYLQ